MAGMEYNVQTLGIEARSFRPTPQRRPSTDLTSAAVVSRPGCEAKGAKKNIDILEGWQRRTSALVTHSRPALGLRRREHQPQQAAAPTRHRSATTLGENPDWALMMPRPVALAPLWL